MRIHGLLTVLAILIIAAGFVPQYMGEIGSMTGEHTGVMLADELGTIGDDFNLSFKDGLQTDTLIMEYYDGTDYITVTDEIAQQFYTYYLLNNDSSQKLFLDGTYEDGVFTDLSGNGNHGIPHNGATTGTGVVGDGMSFDGVDDYVNCGTDSSITEFYSSFSLSFWLDGVKNNRFQELIYNSAGGGHRGFGCLLDSSNKIRLDIRDTLNNSQIFISSYVISENYELITIIYDIDNDKIVLYINGEYHSEKTLSIHVDSVISQYGLYLGAHREYTWYSECLLDEVRIYDRALTGEESEVLYDVPLQMEAWDGYTLYASYEYMDTFSPIGTDLFTIGFPVLGIVILVFVGASYLYNN